MKDYSQIALPYLIEMIKAKGEGRKVFRKNMKKQVTEMIKLITEIFN